MPRSERLKLKDVLAVYRLIGECRELGHDSLAWQRHLLAELVRLVGCRVGIGGFDADVRTASGGIKAVQAADVGWESDADRRIWLRFMTDYRRETDSVFRVSRPVGLPTVQTQSREEFMGNREWYATVFFNDYMRMARLDMGILSWRLLGRREAHAISLHKALGENKSLERECKLVRLLHKEIGQLIGNCLAGPEQPRPSSLPPRIREALECFLEGDSEKRVARRMGVSSFTVHEYVKAIYAHFGVSSRAELLAFFLRRFRGRGPTDGR